MKTACLLFVLLLCSCADLNDTATTAKQLDAISKAFAEYVRNTTPSK